MKQIDLGENRILTEIVLDLDDQSFDFLRSLSDELEIPEIELARLLFLFQLNKTYVHGDHKEELLKIYKNTKGEKNEN